MKESINELYPCASSPCWNRIAALDLTAAPQLLAPDVALCKTGADDLLVRIYDFGVRISSVKQRQYDYGLLVSEPQSDNIELRPGKDATTLIGKRLSLDIGHSPLSFELKDSGGHQVARSLTDGHFVRKHRVPPFAKTDDGWLLAIDLQSGEPVYGLGEKWGALNKRGQLLRSYNHDALGVNAEISYKNVPFCWSPQGWGVFIHTPAPVTHAVGFAPWSQRSYCALVEDEYFDVFIFADSPASAENNPGANIIARYTELTGRAPTPPGWSGGVILSKAYYKDAEEVLAVAAKVRQVGMPCDVISLDGRAWQDTQTRFAFEWCSARYPQPAPFMRQLKALNFKVCVWEYPLISMQHRWFKEFAEKGWLLTDKRTGKAYEYDWDQQAFDKVLTPLPKSGIVDFTHPDAYDFWRDAHKPLFALGVDMIKADFGEQVTDENMLANNGESGAALHNIYSYLYNRCVYEAAERYAPSGAFLFSRSSWSGCQRYNSQWGGDPQADWEGMMSNIRGGISWGLSGAPFYATDIGGFYKDTRDDALYVRWAQAGLFSAHFRLHGIGAREPWSYSEAANAAVTKVLRWRYRLQAYLRQTWQTSNRQGLPVQRAMVLAFPEERQAWAFENQFMFGNDLLVAPCFSPNGDVEFYLPEGQWVQFDLDAAKITEILSGRRVYKKRLALDEIAVFVRRDSKIPLCESLQYWQRHDDEVTATDFWQAPLMNDE